MKALELLCTASMNNPIGSCTYSLMLNEAGGIEADITVTRISEEAFYIVTGAAFTHYLIERVRSLLDIMYRGEVGFIQTQTLRNLSQPTTFTLFFCLHMPLEFAFLSRLNHMNNLTMTFE